jgi:uncharacterized protein (TIGR02145 family)
MIKANLILILFVCLGTISFSQTVTIGTQVWMTKNLDVSKFRNGDPIPEAKTTEEWENAGKNKQPAWCYYDNNPKNAEKYGKLYNWYAVNDARELAPEGWHVPIYDEWKILFDLLGGSSAGVKLKSTSGWKDNGNGTNSTGFSGLPGGFCSIKGKFDYVGGYGYWWSSTESGSGSAVFHNFEYSNGNTYSSESLKGNGFSVRCLKDKN